MKRNPSVAAILVFGGGAILLAIAITSIASLLRIVFGIEPIQACLLGLGFISIRIVRDVTRLVRSA